MLAQFLSSLVSIQGWTVDMGGGPVWSVSIDRESGRASFLFISLVIDSGAELLAHSKFPLWRSCIQIGSGRIATPLNLISVATV